MKYTITRQFSFTCEKFEILGDAKTVCTAKATLSKSQKGQYNLVLINNQIEDCSCLVELDRDQSHQYHIYSINNQTNEKTLFGRLLYKIRANDNVYTIIIGQKLYQVRSSDLKDRRLCILDIDPSNTNHSQVLFQLADSISKSNTVYHVTINDHEWSLGYFALTILLYLHESRRFD